MGTWGKEHYAAAKCMFNQLLKEIAKTNKLPPIGSYRYFNIYPVDNGVRIATPIPGVEIWEHIEEQFPEGMTVEKDGGHAVKVFLKSPKVKIHIWG